RGGNSGGVYAANNQIIDGQASDFALKIAADVNQLQSTVGSIDADIVGVKNDIITIQQELARQQHFRGYYLLNTDIQNLPNSADGDFAFSAESGTVWMYDNEPQAMASTWYNSGQVVPDQVSPASDAVPLVDNATGAAGVSNEYSRGDHQHPLQISSVLPSADTATGEAGTAATYARSDHTHHVNLSNGVPLKDSGTGTAGASNIYANAVHQHPLNVDPTAANVPLVNATAAANGTSDFYSRNDHVHPQQLTYDGNITATKFIKTGGLATEILCANGDTINGVVDLASDQTITAYALYFGTGTTRTCELWVQMTIWSNLVMIEYTNSGLVTEPITDILTTEPVDELPTDYSSIITFTPNLQFDDRTNNNAPFTQNGNMQINPTLAAGFDDGLRISRTVANTGSTSIELGCSRTSNSGAIEGQWVIYTPSNKSLIIAVASQAEDITRGLQISADG
ncbi:MAG: hypothetical protein EZS28_035832, partial [Streblomastix strix]